MVGGITVELKGSRPQLLAVVGPQDRRAVSKESEASKLGPANGLAVAAEVT